ncbi:Inosine/uridine-preferring nucleoside hydrolase domain-containing protein [Russula earlei]|uniref:Inosine/uridine-preferring nucleoside hydrolase domain-containing protein n=1 Tax=Russula earlei TaxID=71964 RepID=A0ACC0UH30_9AGAM|nr:Inosine/uridine-preferring nucleoside hydrolase domain-containing protein [Russula earlei]
MKVFAFFDPFGFRFNSTLSGKLHSTNYFHSQVRICLSIKVTHALRHIISDGLSCIAESHPELNLPLGFLSKSTQNHPHLKIRDSPKPEATLDLLREHAACSVMYVLLGPLTNLTQMLQMDGACVHEKIGHIVVIRGTLDVPGNVTPSTKFNFLVDPYMVDEVLISLTACLPPMKVLLLPLYVTSTHLLLFHGYAKWVNLCSQQTNCPCLWLRVNSTSHFGVVLGKVLG